MATDPLKKPKTKPSVFDPTLGAKKTAKAASTKKADAKKAPLDGRNDKAVGISALGAGIAGGASDLGRGFNNGLSDIGDFLASRPATTKAGSQMFGPDKKTVTKKPGAGVFDKLSKSFGGLDFGEGQLQQQAEEPDVGKSFADYLAMANGLQGGGTDYSALTNQLKANGAQGDAKLAAMYAQLRGSIDADAAPIAQTYDAAGAELNANADRAAATTKSAADAARAQQAQQFGALGIQEGAQQVLASNGSLAATDQAAATGNIEQNRLAGVNKNVINKTSALNYNTGVGNAAGLEGNVQRAALQQALANKLAELQTAQSEEAGGRQQDVISRALQLQSGDQDAVSSAAESRAQQQQQQFENDLSAQRLALDAAKQQGSGVTLDELLGNYSQLQGAAQASGVEDDQFSEWLKNFGVASKLAR